MPPDSQFSIGIYLIWVWCLGVQVQCGKTCPFSTPVANLRLDLPHVNFHWGLPPKTNRVQHRYRNTYGDQGHGYHGYRYGIGIWHTAAYCVPYHSIMGISQVCYNRVSINFIVLKHLFSLI